MLKLLTATAIAAFIAGPAYATDLSTKDTARTASPAAQGWTGPYIGVHGGYSLSSHEVNLDAGGVNVFDLNGLGGNGETVGVIVGYDHLILPQLLIGAYGEYNFTNSETSLSVMNSAYSAALKQGDMWVIGGRVGTFVRGTLVFLNAGYAHTDYELSASFASHSLTKDYDGVLVGGGVELPIGAGFFATAKYDHTFFRDVTWDKTESGSITDTPDVDRIMIGLSWKLGR
jgi:outer membrane immunogenic protein